MSFRFNHLNRLGNRMEVSIPKDDEGYIGRECPQPECEGYFKIKPGTGLRGENLPCFCPCGPFSIGISMKVKHGAPLPIRYYREKALETRVTCDHCTLEYAVFGVFAYCPDCDVHNSLQILHKNLDLTRRQLNLADTLSDVDLRQHLIDDALENCVSAFDGFAREACRIRSAKSTDPAKCASLSFQHLPRGAARLQALFGIDLSASVPLTHWSAAHVGFMRRHVLAHKAGVVDQQYLDETGEPPSLLGRRLRITSDDVRRLADIVMSVGRQLIALLPTPR